MNTLIIGRKWLKASMTVEMSYLMPIVLFLMMDCIFVSFYFHDRNIISGAAYETAVVGSTKMRKGTAVTPEELQELYQERIHGKCIFFSGTSADIAVGEEEIRVSVTARKGRLSTSVEKKAAVTEPEKKIRKIRRLKEIINGAENND